MSSSFVKLEEVNLKNHPELKETWVQEILAEDPSILGLGDLIFKDKERIHTGAGRLDLLLQDADTKHRYEVEIQLGKSDETHLVRTIEYWDIERKRYPQYEHTAVIVAEDITSRFLNVISLFNGSIPLIAIQMKAYRVGDKISLIFTKVLDELKRGFVDDDEEVSEVTDRAYWEKRGSKETVRMVDATLAVIREIRPELELKYNKFYIGLAKDGQASNFIVFKPQKSAMRIEIRLEQSEELDAKMEDAGVDVLEYDKRYGRYKLKLTKKDLEKSRDFLKGLFQASADLSGKA